MTRLSLFVAAAVFMASGPLYAADLLPHQKLGLWQQTITRDGVAMPMGASELCLDQAAEHKLSVFGGRTAGGVCEPAKVTHNLDGSWSADSECRLASGIKSRAYALVVGDFNSKITTTVDSAVAGSPADSLNGTHRMVIIATWLGACKAGQTGGDMILSNGMKINLLNIAKSMRALTQKMSP